jgi:hypothetical protein
MDTFIALFKVCIECNEYHHIVSENEVLITCDLNNTKYIKIIIPITNEIDEYRNYIMMQHNDIVKRKDNTPILFGIIMFYTIGCVSLLANRFYNR